MIVKSLIFAPSLWFGSVVMTLMFNVPLPNLGNPLSFTEDNYPKLSFVSSIALAQNPDSNLVLVYGNPRCGWTNRLIQQLKAKKISYQFKNLDIQSIRDEWNVLLEKNGVPDGTSIDLPVVLINGKVFIRPSIEQVISQRQKPQNSSPKIPNGTYIGETHSDALIEVKNNQYCGANLGTGLIECDPLSDLKYIKPGVLQMGDDDDGYFCSQELFEINLNSDSQRGGRCTAEGWVWTR